MPKPLAVLAPAAALLCLVLAGCRKQEKLIKIATQTPLSGSVSAIGVDIKNGAQLAFEQLGGPLTQMGFKLGFAPFDDQGNPDTGVANAKAIGADKAILAVVGHIQSGVQIPSSEEYHAAGLANVSPGNTNPRVTDRGYPEISRICGRDDVQGAVGAQFAKSKGIRTAYVLHDKTSYGQGVAEFFKKECEAQGIQVLGFAGTEEKSNFDAILSPVLAARPDCLYAGQIFDQASVLIKQARQKGFKGMFLAPDAFDATESAKIAGHALLEGGGTYYTTVSGPASVYQGTAKFIADFKNKFGAPPQPFAAQGYDACAVAMKAIENAAKAAGGKVPTRAAVVQAVRELKDFQGITGTFNFNGKGDLVMGRYFIIQVISDDPGKWSDNRIDKILDVPPPV